MQLLPVRSTATFSLAELFVRPWEGSSLTKVGVYLLWWLLSTHQLCFSFTHLSASWGQQRKVLQTSLQMNFERLSETLELLIAQALGHFFSGITNWEGPAHPSCRSLKLGRVKPCAPVRRAGTLHPPARLPGILLSLGPSQTFQLSSSPAPRATESPVSISNQDWLCSGSHESLASSGHAGGAGRFSQSLSEL